MLLTWFVPLLLLMMVFFAQVMILASHPVRSVLALMGCFLASSVLMLMMGADFIALVLIFVYIGAVMTLFLFMVLMLNVTRYADHYLIARLHRCYVVTITFLVPGLLYLWLRYHGLAPLLSLSVMRVEWGLSTAHLIEFSQVLYQDYWVPLQLLAFILMVPMLVATGVVRQGRSQSVKWQQRSKQVAVQAKDRLTLVNVKQAGKR